MQHAVAPLCSTRSEVCIAVSVCCVGGLAFRWVSARRSSQFRVTRPPGPGCSRHRPRRCRFLISLMRLTKIEAVRATVHHVRPATYAHTNLDLHTRIVARVQHVAQRHCHLLSYLSHHRNQSPHPSSSAIIRNHRHPVPHRRFRRCTPRPALHTQRASNAHAQAAPLSASAAATAQRRTRSQSHDHHHHVPQAALRPKR